MEEHLKKAGFNTFGSLNFPVSDADAKEIDTLLDSGEYSSFRLTKAHNLDGLFKAERAEISIITDDSVDDDKEIFPPESLDFKHFEKYGNPVFFNHRYDLIPVGRALWFKKSGNGYKAKTQYITRPENHPKEAEWLPDSIWHLVQNELMKGKSIGGLKKMRPITQEDLNKNPSWSGARSVCEKAIVWEYSACVKGINSNAIVEGLVKSAFKLDKEIIDRDFPEVAEELKKMKKEADEIPLIKSYKTIEDYQKERQHSIDYHIQNIKESIPQLVEDTINRALGRAI